MIRHILMTQGRYEPFAKFKLQRSIGSIPDYPSKIIDDLKANPPTKEEWQWVAENSGLLRLAAKKRRETFFHSEGLDDLANFCVPIAIRAIRHWRADGGAVRGTLVTIAAFNWLAWERLKPRAYLCGPTYGKKGINANPILLGDYEPVIAEAQEPEPDQTELFDQVHSAFDSLPHRWQDVLSKYLGFTGERQSSQIIADEYGLSRERILQIICNALKWIAEVVGFDPAIVRRNGGNKTTKVRKKVSGLTALIG